MSQTHHKTAKAPKRASVSEITDVFLKRDVSIDDVVVRRLPDGTIEVFKRYQHTEAPKGENTDWDDAPAFR